MLYTTWKENHERIWVPLSSFQIGKSVVVVYELGLRQLRQEVSDFSEVRTTV